MASFKMIPYGRQEITQADIDAVTKVLTSDFLTQGPCVPRFEECLANYCGSRHAVAVNSATSALHLACLALGLGEGDWLWTSPITFVASANCAIYCGARVDFVDIDPRTANMSVKALEVKLLDAEQQNRLPKIVVPVHIAGSSCDMQKIHSLSKRFGFKIIEDASHAVGARYDHAPVGRCQYSDITVFSFHPVKIITTAEGGAALTNQMYLAERMALLRSHGVTRDPEMMHERPDGPWSYEQIDLGFNYRMTELQAALGISQMDRLDDYVRRRNEIASQYDESLKELSVSALERGNDLSACHLYVVKTKSDQSEPSHRKVFEGLRERGVMVNLHYIPVHTQPFYRAMGFAMGNFPEAERYYRQAISLPMYPTLTEKQQNQVVEALRHCLQPS